MVHEMGFRLGHDLFVQPQAIIGKQRGSFDVVRTQRLVERVTNVWAFNVATLEPLEREIQSWNFLVSRLRQDGASLRIAGNRELALAPDTPVEVIYDPLRSQSDRQWRTDIFEAAIEAWEINHVTFRTLDEFLNSAREDDLVSVN
ncbi:hypothetical protein QN345_00175 [Cryobacterium sp. 10I1]|uniref:hypothetical protein n=1 Tax=unclassified Cryobacterium TaxID=2649013 RepID=UPI002AC8F273|nr:MULTISPECIES: hypothetical protein [unclassified Cryobacterium]MEB0286783.1 hypothetical protein [Cryobacterium sp. 10S3]MEB0303754.1 hypothetical protein [Cryobacterium sp. 10I1]WPX12667.1 hypothetical protein RHM57_13405 [Cryobacterium sp. 10S3]